MTYKLVVIFSIVALNDCIAAAAPLACGVGLGAVGGNIFVCVRNEHPEQFTESYGKITIKSSTKRKNLYKSKNKIRKVQENVKIFFGKTKEGC